MQSFGSQKRREQNAINSGYYVLPAMPKGSARNMLRPIIAMKLLSVNIQLN
jgi:hypothetical protein